MTDEEQEPRATGAVTELQRAADRLRDTTKWLIASFGAIAAVVFAGVAISDIGTLDFATPNYRFQIAILGGVCTLIGVTGALVRSMHLAGASTTIADDLTRETKAWERALASAQKQAASDPALHLWNQDLRQFADAYATAFATYLEELQAYGRDPHPNPSTDHLEKAASVFEHLQAVTARVLNTVAFLRLQKSFLYARWVIAGWLLLAAAGAVAFTWAANPPTGNGPGLAQQPISADLTPSPDTSQTIQARTIEACWPSGDRLDVIVIAIDDESGTAEVVTLPNAGCPPLRLQVSLTEIQRRQAPLPGDG